MNKSRRADFYTLLGIIFVSVPIIIHFQFRPLTSAVFLFIIPTLYLFYRKKKPFKELLLGSLLIGNGFGLIFNIIASASGAWNELGTQLVFNHRLFGFMPIDEPIWFFFWALFILTFYEHFYEKDRRDKLSKRFQYVAVPIFITVIFVCIVATIDRELLSFKYAYSLTLSPIIIPVMYVVLKKPSMLLKLIKTSVFFFMVCLTYELIAIKLGQWYFPGQYIGWIELFGLRFPFEELLFWMVLSPFTVVALYESFVDNGK